MLNSEGVLHGSEYLAGHLGVRSKWVWGTSPAGQTVFSKARNRRTSETAGRAGTADPPGLDFRTRARFDQTPKWPF
eukprot:10995292-Alexandrium_andersonii.AAC.2